MPERLQIAEISLPQDLKAFLVRARINTFASGAEPIPSASSPGAKLFRYFEQKMPYIYLDEYHTHTQKPGVFSGAEMVRREREDGPRLFRYSYDGALTAEGLQLGETVVFGMLKGALRGKAAVVRLGNRVMFDIDSAICGEQSPLWQYEGYGTAKPWGWQDIERIVHNQVLVYEFVGQGIPLRPGISEVNFS